MELREPKKKRRVKLQPRIPFPIPIDGSNEWTTYTAHLTDLGSCIVNPTEIIAIHSMGYFGKGSLSRSYPCFGKARYGAPPIIRNRQWIRRSDWLKEVKILNEESLVESEQYDKNISSECPYKDTKMKEDIKEVIKSNGKISQVVDAKQIRDQSSEGNKVQEIEIVKCDKLRIESVEDDICVILSNEVEDGTFEKLDKNSKEQHDNGMEEFLGFNDFVPESESIYTITDNAENLQGKLLVLPDSDSDTEGYLQKVKPRIEDEGFPIRETLHLTFEETFFLLYALGCLQVINFDGSILDINNAWIYFCKEDKYFVQKYVVYHYFRTKGWVVKPGIKYGGDFLLYKQGPPFYHASYIVIIEVVDADTLIKNFSKCMHKMTWNNLFGLDRLSETTAKEILFAQVLWPSSIPDNINLTTPDILAEFTVKELLWRRWNPKQNRDMVNLEEEESS